MRHVDPPIRNGRHTPEGARVGPPRRGLLGAVYNGRHPRAGSASVCIAEAHAHPPSWLRTKNEPSSV